MRAKTNIERNVRIGATFDAVVRPDAAKARVMACFRELVAGGHADWQALEDGNVRLRLRTGEVYLLGQTTITRLA